MENILSTIKKNVYDQADLKLSQYQLETESAEYAGSRFQLNELLIICRNAKVTPKKAGLFVTFWKRNDEGITTPLNESDCFDYYVVNVKLDNHFGQFVFPKSVLMKEGIISSSEQEGKRAFRVYPPWQELNSNQAQKTQKWQVNYFYEIGSSVDHARVIELYKMHLL